MNVLFLSNWIVNSQVVYLMQMKWTDMNVQWGWNRMVFEIYKLVSIWIETFKVIVYSLLLLHSRFSVEIELIWCRCEKIASFFFFLVFVHLTFHHLHLVMQNFLIKSFLGFESNDLSKIINGFVNKIEQDMHRQTGKQFKHMIIILMKTFLLWMG